MFLLVFHALSAYAYGSAIIFDYRLTADFQLRLPVAGAYVSKFVWLTMINLYVQFAYNIFACLLLLYDAREWKIPFHKYATTLVFPLAITVVVLFWGLIFFDPNFLLNEETKRVLSYAWFNHIIHTLPLFVAVFDHVGWRHPRTKKSTALFIIAIFVVAYVAVVHYVYYVHNFWAYPILGALDSQQRAVFIGVCVLFFFVAYLIGDAILALLRRPKTKVTRKVR